MPPSIPGPAYRLVTSRLILRCWNPSDAPLLKAAIDANLDHLKPWMPWAKHEPTDLQTKIEWLRRCRARFDAGQDFTYGIFDPAERRVLGGSGLHTRLGEGAREIGYWIDQDFINQGLATEVTAALTRVAFEIEGVNRIEIHCDPQNVRSAAVPKKLGYTYEATLLQRTRDWDDNWRDSMVWTLLARDYPHTPSAQSQLSAFDAANRQIM
jgi:RimJ/RimL family protein N-acetyltransferase